MVSWRILRCRIVSVVGPNETDSVTADKQVILKVAIVRYFN